MSFVNWNDVFHELWLQAAQSRGTVTSVGEMPGASRYSTLPEWPRTTGGDAIAIASLVDPILRATPLRPGGYGITQLWQTAVIELEAVAFPNPSTEYVHNRAWWSTLLAVAAHLSTMGAPAPHEDDWEALLATLWSPVCESRNASGPSTRMLIAPNFAPMWDKLRAELATVCGSDFRDDELGGTLDVPRTTNADVLLLDRYWSRALTRLQIKVMTGEVQVPAPDDFEHLQLEWEAVTEHIDRDARSGKAQSVYPHNLELWRATRAIAAACSVLAAEPPPYELVAAGQPAPAPAPPTQPPTPAASPPKAADLSSRLNDAASGAVNAFTHLVHDASARLTASIGKPLLITGATLAALLLLLHGTVTCECDCGGEPIPTGEAG